MKRTLYTLAFIVFALNANSQPGTGCAMITNSGANNCWDMVKTSDNNFVLAGTVQPGGDYVKNYLVKVNAQGDTIWTSKLGIATGSVYLYSVTETADQGIVAVGSLNTTTMSVVKLSSDGTFQWCKSILVNSHDEGAGVLPTPDGGVFIACATVQIVSPNYFQAYCIKLDASGNKEWEYCMRNQGNVYQGAMQSMCVGRTIDNHYLIGGWSPSAGVLSNLFYVVCLDSTGTYEWSKEADASGVSFSFIAMPDSGFVVAGYGCRDGFGCDSYLAKFAIDGALEWDQYFGSDSLYDAIFDAQPTSDGGFITVGVAENQGAMITKGLIYKTDSLGNVEWSRIIGSETQFTDLRAVAEVNDGYVFAGRRGQEFFIGQVDLNGNVCQTCIGEEYGVETGGSNYTDFSPINDPMSAVLDDFIFTTHQNSGTTSLICTGIGIEEIDNEAPVLFPNPVEDQFIIQNRTGATMNVDIFNLPGQKVYSTSSLKSGKAVNVEALPKGIYFVRITSGDRISIQKITKSN